MKVLIHHWDAVELFSRIISKLEERSIEDFYDYKILHETLTHYAITQVAKNISRKIIRKENTLLSLVNMIRTKQPVVLTNIEFKKLLEYIGKDKPVAHQELKDIWIPKQKAPRFIGRWWLFFYEEINNFPGVVRAIINFRPFNKVNIDSLRGDTGQKESYLGKYHMYGTDAKYMRLTLQLDGTDEKDLNMLFYIGSDVPDLSLGQYSDVDGAIYSGTLVLERTNVRGHRNPGFFPFNEKSDKIPGYIWEYFENKRLNRLRVPAQITNVQKMKSWLAIQRAKKAKD